MAEYFGKGCEFLGGQWEDGDKNSVPTISCCNHVDNPDIYEGSCNESQCPILLEMAYIYWKKGLKVKGITYGPNGPL